MTRKVNYHQLYGTIYGLGWWVNRNRTYLQITYTITLYHLHFVTYLTYKLYLNRHIWWWKVWKRKILDTPQPVTSFGKLTETRGRSGGIVNPGSRICRRFRKLWLGLDLLILFIFVILLYCLYSVILLEPTMRHTYENLHLSLHMRFNCGLLKFWNLPNKNNLLIFRFYGQMP